MTIHKPLSLAFLNALTYHLQLVSMHAAHNLVLVDLRIIKFLLSLASYIINARFTASLFCKSQPFTKMHPIFPYVPKYLRRMTWKEVCRQWSYLYHAGRQYHRLHHLHHGTPYFPLQNWEQVHGHSHPCQSRLTQSSLRTIHIIKIFTIIHSMIFIFIFLP